MAFDVWVAGTSLANLTVANGRVVIQEWPGIMAKQIEVSLPKLSASTWPDLAGIVTPRPFSVGLVLVADTAPAFNSLYDAVAAVVETASTVILHRVRDITGSTEIKLAKAVYLGGMEPTMQSHAAAKCVPRWQLLAEWA